MQRRSSSLVALVAAVGLMSAVAVGAEKHKAANNLPDGFKGFNGTLGGDVVSVEANHMHGFRLKVDKVLHVNSDSRASDANAIVGHEININPETHQDANGKWVADDQQMAFIDSLKKGDHIQVDVKTDGEHVRISELTHTQKGEAEKERKHKG